MNKRIRKKLMSRQWFYHYHDYKEYMKPPVFNTNILLVNTDADGRPVSVKLFKNYYVESVL